MPHTLDPVEPVPLADLRPHPGNYRTHPPEQIAHLAASLSAHGVYRNVVAARDGTLLAGHGVVEAARSLGIDAIPVRRLDLDPSDPRALAILAGDNTVARLAADDDAALAALLDGIRAEDRARLLGTGYEEAAVDELLARLAADAGPTPGLTDPDDVPEPPAEPVTKPGDLWQLGRHRLLCGDATKAADVERLMDGEKADLVWTDPPYGVAIGDKNKWLNSVGRSNRVARNLANDTLDEGALLRLLRDAFSLAAAACTAGAGWYAAAPAGPLHLLFGQALKELGIWRQTLIWVKDNATFAPLGVTYHWQAEPIFYGWVPGAAHSDFTDRTQTTVWAIDRPRASPDHQTAKPVELVARAIDHATRAGDAVLDPFVGSGTTIMAAELLGRRCFALEIDPVYCDVAVRRWEAFTGQTAVMAERVPTEGSP